jgi:centromere protein C
MNRVRNAHSSQDEEGSDEEAILHGEQQEEDSRDAEESMAMIHEGGDDLPDLAPDDDDDRDLGEDSRHDQEVVRTKATSSRGKGQKEGATRNVSPPAARDDDEEPVRRKRGRPAKAKVVSTDENREQRGSAKRRRSDRVAEDDPQVEMEPEPEPKKLRTAGKGKGRKPTKPTDDAAGPAKAATKGRHGRARSPSVDAADASLAVVPRGPPLPKSRGLLINRRELPGDAGMVRTRSGRTSFKPLAFWRNEHVDYDQDEAMDDAFSSRRERFVLPAIKEVHRVDEPEPVRPTKRRGRPASKGGAAKGRRGKRRDSEDAGLFDEPAEPWEEEPGIVTGDAVVWQPEYEYAPPGLDEEIEVTPERLAVSGLAIETREIRNATFRFSKTLSLPFFGAGVVDLPPGSVKRPKNSRKMYMTFFVYAGTVLVTVNESTFRIGRGGMWFVPRGQFVSSPLFSSTF